MRELIKACWHEQSSSRPTFENVVKKIEDFLAVDESKLMERRRTVILSSVEYSKRRAIGARSSLRAKSSLRPEESVISSKMDASMLPTGTIQE